MLKKKILLISDVKGWGGWERGEYIKKYCSDLFDVDLVDTTEFRILVKKASSNYIEGNRDFKSFFENEKLKDKDGFYNITDFLNFLKNNKKIKYNLFYFLFHTMLAQKEAKYLMNKNEKIFTAVTGYPTIKEIFNSYDNPTLEFKRLADKCIGIAANNIKSLKDLEKIYNGNIYYFPRGVDPDVFKNEKWPEGDLKALYVGKNVKEKGLDDIIKPACEKAGVELIINDRNYENALNKKEMNELYNSCHVLMVASTIDGTPNPALEAASCGRLLISNKIGNMPEFIEDGKNGFLIDRKIDEYVDKLEFAKKYKKRVKNMGIKARETILRNWTWENLIRRNEKDIFRRILGA